MYKSKKIGYSMKREFPLHIHDVFGYVKIFAYIKMPLKR